MKSIKLEKKKQKMAWPGEQREGQDDKETVVEEELVASKLAAAAVVAASIFGSAFLITMEERITGV